MCVHVLKNFYGFFDYRSTETQFLDYRSTETQYLADLATGGKYEYKVTQSFGNSEYCWFLSLFIRNSRNNTIES